MAVTPQEQRSMRASVALEHAVAYHSGPGTTGIADKDTIIETADFFYEWLADKGGEPVAAGPGAGSLPPQQATVTPIGPPPSQPAGEPCEVCGQAKQWKDGGISRKSGKPYDGFWACPRYREHPKTTA